MLLWILIFTLTMDVLIAFDKNVRECDLLVVIVEIINVILIFNLF